MSDYKATDVRNTAFQIGKNFNTAQDNLLRAYSLKDGDKDAVAKMAKDLGLPASEKQNIRAIQLIAEQRFQGASQSLNLFSNILDKIVQLKQRLINKFGN